MNTQATDEIAILMLNAESIEEGFELLIAAATFFTARAAAAAYSCGHSKKEATKCAVDVVVKALNDVKHEIIISQDAIFDSISMQICGNEEGKNNER